MKSLVDEIKFATSMATLGSFAFLIWSFLWKNIDAFTSGLILWGSLFMIISAILRIFETVAREGFFRLYKEESPVNKLIEGISYFLFIVGLLFFALSLLMIIRFVPLL